VKKYASEDFNVDDDDDDDDEQDQTNNKSGSKDNGQSHMEDEEEQLSDIDDMPADSGISTDPAADLEL